MVRRNIDKKLSDAMTKESYCLPNSYQEKVRQTLDDLPERHSEKRTINWSYPKRAAILVSLCAIFTVTSISANSLIEEHLSKMDSQDMQKYVDTVEKQPQIEVDGYTRELTDTERERMDELFTDYRKGTFPEKELMICKTVEEAETISYCFIEENSTYKIPETELTDEQLLQMIDFRQKREYSLKKANEESGASTEELVDICVTEQEATESARQLVERFYQVDISDYKVVSKMYGQYYTIIFYKSNTIYTAWVKPDNGQAIYVEIDTLEKSLLKDCSLNETLVAEMYNTARNALEAYLSPDSKITRSCYTYGVMDDTLYEGTVKYVFEDSEGNCYYLGYSFNTNQIYFMNILPDYDTHVKNFVNGKKENGMNNETILTVTINVEDK